MDKRVYLGKNLLQQDMRFRLPKSVLVNLRAEAGKSIFEIYLDVDSNEIVLKLSNAKGDNKDV